MSVLSLEKNARVLSSKQTKHIKAKYFLIKDYYDAREIDVKFCPTDGMWADVLTKLYKVRNSGTCMHSSRIALEIMTMIQNKTN